MTCEGQLNVFRAGTEALTQQLDNTKDELDMVQRELTHSYLLQKEPQQQRHLTPPLAVSRETSPSQAQSYKGGDKPLCLTRHQTVSLKLQQPRKEKD